MSAKAGTSRAAARKNGASPEIEVNPDIMVDLSGWYMDDFIRWTDAAAMSGSASILALNDLMTTAIKAWPFEGDPTVAADYRFKLHGYEWKEALEAVKAAAGNAFQRPGERGDQGDSIQKMGSRANGSGNADAAGADDPDAQEDR